MSRQLGIEEHEGYLVTVLMVLNWIKIAGVSPYASFLLKVFLIRRQVREEWYQVTEQMRPP